MWNCSLKKKLEMGLCSLQVGRWWVLRLGHIYSRCEMAVEFYKIETNNIFKWALFYRPDKAIKALKKMWIHIHDLQYSWSVHEWLRYTCHKNLGTRFWDFGEVCWCLLSLFPVCLWKPWWHRQWHWDSTRDRAVITTLSCEMLALVCAVGALGPLCPRGLCCLSDPCPPGHPGHVTQVPQGWSALWPAAGPAFLGWSAVLFMYMASGQRSRDSALSGFSWERLWEMKIKEMIKIILI